MNINQLSFNYQSWANAAKEAFAIKPKEVNPYTWRWAFYRDLLTRDYLGSVKIECPEWWYKDYIRSALLINGSMAVVRYNGVVVPAYYTVIDRNVWHYPKIIKGATEVDFPECEVGVDAEIVYLNTAGYLGIGNILPMQIIDIFARKMADCDAAIDINIFNTKTPWIFEADSKTDAENMKAMYTKVQSGEPAVFWKRNRKSMSDKPVGITTMPIKNNYIADLVQKEKEAIRNEFLTIFGINNTNAEKKERLLVDEVNANNEHIEASVDLWQQNVDDASERIRKLFNVEFTVKFYPARKGEMRNDSNGFGAAESSVK